MDCIFCKIGCGEIPSSKVYEDDSYLAFLDISPVNKGHTLIIPKKHVETFDELTENEACEIVKIARKIAIAIKLATKCDGYNIIVNNGEASGQEVKHLHFHVMPRFENDGTKISWDHKSYDSDIEIVLAKIKENI